VVLRGVSAVGDHDTVMLMGIQGSDKAYAQAQYEALLVAVAAARLKREQSRGSMDR